MENNEPNKELYGSESPLETGYYAVIYCKTGETDISPVQPTQEAAIEFLRKSYEAHPEWLEKTKATTIIKRNMSNVRDGYLFGHPKSLDLMQDKKFIKSLEA